MTPAMSRRGLALLLLWGPVPLLFLWASVAPSRELRLAGFVVYLGLVGVGWYLASHSRQR